MKRFMHKIVLLFTLILVTGVILISCKEEEKPNGGIPKIDYVRLTDPAKADSFLTSANMGQLIAIVGQNLSGARQIFFNDKEGFLNPTYTTDPTILVSIPKGLPTVKTDKMTLIFEDGYELVYDFEVTIPPPALASIKCEYVPDGDIVVLYGDYFYEPLTVTFAGGLEGELDSVGETKIKVVVPDGATTGKITVANSVGSSESPFLFRDNRNTILDFDVLINESWTATMAYADSNPEIIPTSGNYVILEWPAVTAWNWPSNNELNIQAWGEGVRGNLPLATGSIFDLDYRFEINVPIPWVDVRMEVFFAPYGLGHARDAVDGSGNYITSFCRWRPWLAGAYTTDGWVTISIPLTDFAYGHDDGTGATPAQGSKPLQDLTGLTNLTIMVFGPQESDLSTAHPLKICIDNVRIVPHEVE